jgi:D-serine deaminase-like pyridoxal phosphate-dependent protein
MTLSLESPATPSAALDSLDTPAALVDLVRLDRNLTRAADYARAHGLALRPHIKTHKSKWIAREQLTRGAVGVTCATPHEARVMSDVATDILVAYPPVGAGRARRLVELPRSVQLCVALDSTHALRDLSDAARAADRPVGVLVELDVGMRRVGVATAAEVVELARAVATSAPLEFRGLAFYPGHIRQSASEQDAALSSLRDALAESIDRLGAAGLAPRVVSGGSTPTIWRTHDVAGVTEFRPGTYVFNDRTTALVGACDWDDCALSVLATVVSTAVAGQAVIDAGSKALGREPLRASEGDGFGVLMEHPDVAVKSMSEEHGVLDLARTDWKPVVGERVRVIPNHVCVVVHLNDVLYGIREGRVERCWTVDARGRGAVVPC